MRSTLHLGSAVSRLNERLKHPLPGEDAQYLMAPLNRPRRDAFKHIEDYRKGAVLILLYEQDESPYLLMMKRKTYDGPHSGQVCFPGGKAEDFDRDCVQTALREADEELAVKPEYVDVLGELSPLYIPPSRFYINPVVGVYSGEALWKPDDFEVDKVVETPLVELLSSRSVKRGNIYAPSLKTEINVPYFELSGQKVWGATAMILSELKSILDEK